MPPFQARRGRRKLGQGQDGLGHIAFGMPTQVAQEPTAFFRLHPARVPHQTVGPLADMLDHPRLRIGLDHGPLVGIEAQPSLDAGQ